MIKEDYEIIVELSKQRRLSPEMKYKLQYIIRKYIDVNYIFCQSCDAAVRIAYKRFKKFIENITEKNYKFIREL